VGGAQYSIIVASDGGMLDDLVIYRLETHRFLVVANAVNGEVVARELRARIGAPIEIVDHGSSRGLIAIQGPASETMLAPLVRLDSGHALADLPFYAIEGGCLGRGSFDNGVQTYPLLVARTGYTGEDGFELYLDADDAPAVWDTVLAAGGPAGLQPIGLGARDTLRLEAGMPLYGNELRADLTPYDVGLGRVVRLDKGHPFVGDAALRRRAAAAEGTGRRLVGLRITGRGIARHGHAVLDERGAPAGTVTSGTHSPTLGVPIALADLSAAAGDCPPGRTLSVLVRDLPIAAEVVAVPFVAKRTRRRTPGGTT
jgi:aminomethyltransferase